MWGFTCDFRPLLEIFLNSSQNRWFKFGAVLGFKSIQNSQKTKTKCFQVDFEQILVHQVKDSTQIVGGEDQSNVRIGPVNSFFGDDVVEVPLGLHRPVVVLDDRLPTFIAKNDKVAPRHLFSNTPLLP